MFYKDLLKTKFMPNLISDGGVYVGNGYINPYDRSSNIRKSELERQSSISYSHIKEETITKEVIGSDNNSKKMEKNTKKDNATIILEYLNIVKEIKQKNIEIANLEVLKEDLWKKISASPELMDMIEDMINTKEKVNKK